MITYLTSAEATPTLTSKKVWDGGNTETWDDIGNVLGNYSGSGSGANGYRFKSTKEYEVKDGVTSWSSSSSESGSIAVQVSSNSASGITSTQYSVGYWVTSSGVSTATSSQSFVVMQGTETVTKTETYSELKITTTQSSSSSNKTDTGITASGDGQWSRKTFTDGFWDNVPVTQVSQTSASGSSSYSAQGAYIVGWQTTETSTVWGWKTSLTSPSGNYVDTAGTTKVVTYSTGAYSGTNSETKKIITTTSTQGDSFGATLVTQGTETTEVTITIIKSISTTSRKSVLNYHTVYKWEPKETTTLYIFTATEIGKSTTKFEDLCTSYTTDTTLTAPLGILSGERETYDANGALTFRSKTKGGYVTAPPTILKESTLTITTFTETSTRLAYPYPAVTTTDYFRGTETETASSGYQSSWERDEYTTTSDGSGNQNMSETYEYLDYTTTTANPAGFTSPVLGTATSFRDYAFKLGTYTRTDSDGNIVGKTECSGNYTYSLGHGRVSPFFQFYIKRLSGQAAPGAGSNTANYGLYSSADVSGTNSPLGKPNLSNTTDIAFAVAGITAKRPYCNPLIILERSGSSKNTSRTSNMIYVNGEEVAFVTTSKNSSTGSSSSKSASVKTVGKPITYYGGDIKLSEVDIAFGTLALGGNISNTSLGKAWTTQRAGGTDNYKRFCWAQSVSFMDFEDTLVLGGLFDTRTSGTIPQTTSYPYTTLKKSSVNLSFGQLDMYFVC